MKKIVSIILIVLSLINVAACSAKNDLPDSTVENVDNDIKQETSDNDIGLIDDSENSQAEEAKIQENITKQTVRIAAMTGPTGMGMAKLLSDNDESLCTNHYDFTLAGAADEITPLIVKGDLDIAAVPINLASILYNNTDGAVQLLAINTLGVLYILDNNNAIKEVEDLKGKTIFATGKGSTPEYTLRYILTQNGIDPNNDINIEWKSEPAEIVSLFQNSSNEVIAMMPQPYVTIAQNSVENINIALNLTEEWNKISTESACLTGCIIVRKEFAEDNPAVVNSFISEYEQSVHWVNDNIEAAADLMELYGIIKSAVARKAIPYCNITCLTGDQLKIAESYLAILYEMNPKAVGGKMPTDDFYYQLNQ